MEQKGISSAKTSAIAGDSLDSGLATLGDTFDRVAESNTKEAVVFPSERITYKDLLERSNRFAKALLGFGIGYQDKVGLFLLASIDYVALLLAIAKIGAVAVPISTRFKAEELRFCAEKADIKILFSQPGQGDYTDYAGLASNALFGQFDSESAESTNSKTSRLAYAVCLYGDAPCGLLAWDQFISAADTISDSSLVQASSKVSIKDPAFFIFTSGTTAHPKAVILSHEQLCRVIDVVIDDYWPVYPEDVIWMPLPLYHIGGVLYLFMSLASEAKLCMTEYFDPQISLEQLERERCTIALPAFDTIWLDVLTLPSFSSADLSSIKRITVVGSYESLLRMQAYVPHATQVSVYGSTECILLTATRPEDPEDVRHKTCGYPIPGMELRIVDKASGSVLGANQSGELQFRGLSLFSGYYNDPELTEEAFEDGWFCSGDSAQLDDSGRLQYKGRLKDIIKIRGENVSAAEVEDYLMGHPSVFLAQVVSAPDSRLHEVPAAYIQLNEGTTASAEEIIEFCVGKIANFKIPRYVRFVTEWPMSGTKIQKYVLRERIASELKEAGIIAAPKIRHRTSYGQDT